METAQLNEPQMKRLDVFQLKAMRKILKMNTTFVNRTNTNNKVFEDANAQMWRDGGKKGVMPFRKAYMCSKLKQVKRIINQNTREPTRSVTFRRELEIWIPPNRRQGRPAYKWANRALLELLENIQEKQPQHRTTAYNINNSDIQRIIKEFARQPINT